MFEILAKVTCGNVTGIPAKLPKLSSEAFTLIEIAIPIILVLMGTIDLFKAITANKEDEMTKARGVFVKRLITGALVFFIFAIIKLVIGFIDNKANTNNITQCMDCFINNKCDNYNSPTKKTSDIPEDNYEIEYEEENEKVVVEMSEEEVNEKLKEKGKLDDSKIGSFTKSYGNINYFIKVPEGSKKNMPLVIFLHGRGEQNNITAVKNLGPVTSVVNGAVQGTEKFIFLAPASPGSNLWHESNTWSSLINLIDEITKEYSIDSNRIYLTGFSAGGCAVWGLVNKYPTKFRAAVPVSCTWTITPSNFKNTPIYAISGGNEGYVSGMQNSVNEINKIGGKATFKSIPNADHIKTQSSYSTKELYTWLLSQ